MSTILSYFKKVEPKKTDTSSRLVFVSLNMRRNVGLHTGLCLVSRLMGLHYFFIFDAVPQRGA